MPCLWAASDIDALKMSDSNSPPVVAPDGKANGYRFQDAIGAELLLASLSDAMMRTTFENKSHDNDKFDDLIVERNGETIRLQCKNGPDFTPTDAAWRSGGGRGIKWANLCTAIESHLNSGGDDERYILLTSFRAPEDLETHWMRNGSLRTMAGREYKCYVRKSPMDDEAPETTARLEVVFGAEHHNAKAAEPREEETTRGIQDSPWWAEALECLKRLPPQIDNPHLAQPDHVLAAALNASNGFRAARQRQATGDDAAEAMHIAAGSFHLQQASPVEEFEVIEPHWIADVHSPVNQSGSRIWLVGSPGCGKSTAIQHLCSEEEPITYRLYHPGDSPDDVRARLRPEIFRHELAGTLDLRYPDTIPWGLKADSSVRAIKERLDAIASTIDEGELGPLLIFDGLDHDFRDGNQGRLVHNLMTISFPSSFRVLVLSRPLEGMDDPQGFEQIPLPPWNDQDIKRWLTTNGQPDGDNLVEILGTASGGSPLILSMILRRAIGREEELQEVAARFGEAEGVLDDFLSKLLAETRPAIHDALALLVVHTYPMRQDMLKAVVGLPSVATDAFSGHGLQSICPLKERGVELPHAYLGQFIRQQAEADGVWAERLHAAQQRMLQFCTDGFRTAAIDAELLYRLLEGDKEIQELAGSIGSETLVQWAKAGVHEEAARDALQTVFRLGAKIHDPRIMMRIALLADRVQNLFEIETSAPQRLHYFAAIGDDAAGERLARQIIEQEDRNGSDASESVLQAMYYLHEHDLEKATMDDVKALHKALRGPHGHGGLSWEQALSAKARLDSPEGFWELAVKANEQHDGKLGIKMTILRSSPRDEEGLIIGPADPPDWLTSNAADAVRIGAWLLSMMPTKWIEQIRNIASTHDPASLAERFAVALFVPPRREEMADFKPDPLAIPHYDPHAEEPPFADAFYLGALAAWAEEDAEQIHDRLIGHVGDDGTARHMLLAAIGAWLAHPEATMGPDAFQDRLSFLARYGGAVQPMMTWNVDLSASASFAYMASVITDSKVASVLPDDSSSMARNAGLSNLASEVEPVLRAELDVEVAAQGISAKRSALLAMKPGEFGPCRDLVDLAIEAAELSHDKLAKQCFNDGLKRGFRYGHRKDLFLIDVWEALIEVDKDLAQESGLAIQLLNWSCHLHTVTDGKETRWFEGQILEKLLDLHWTDLQSAREVADAAHTTDALVKWSIENETPHDREEWGAMLAVVRQSSQGWEDTKSSRLVRLSGQALERGETEIGCELLREAVDTYRPTFRFTEEDLQRFNQLVAAHQPELVGKIELKEDTYTPECWIPKTGIGKVAAQDRLDAALDNASHGDLAEGFQDLWSSRQDAHREQALTVLAKLMETEPELGWKAAGKALLETSRMARGWGSGFRQLCGFLVDQDAERTLFAALDAWRNDSIQGRPYGYGNLPNLCWLVKQVQGREVAMAIIRDSVEILRRSLEPHEHRVQAWGRVQEIWQV